MLHKKKMSRVGNLRKASSFLKKYWILLYIHILLLDIIVYIHALLMYIFTYYYWIALHILDYFSKYFFKTQMKLMFRKKKNSKIGNLRKEFFLVFHVVYPHHFFKHRHQYTSYMAQ